MVYEIVIGVSSVVAPVVLWSLDRWRPPRSGHGPSLKNDENSPRPSEGTDCR